MDAKDDKHRPYDRDSVDHVLTTTRSVRRRLDFDRSIEPEVIEECISIAIQVAPGGGEARPWHFMVVTDEAKKDAIGGLYPRGLLQVRRRPPHAPRHRLPRRQSPPLPPSSSFPA